jgi:hypothetical protein
MGQIRRHSLLTKRGRTGRKYYKLLYLNNIILIEFNPQVVYWTKQYM